jgi:hypothetical protein
VCRNSGSRTKNRKNRKNSTKIDFFLNFSFDKFSLKLIENTTKMTLKYLDIAQLGFETKKKFEKNYDRVLNHCAGHDYYIVWFASTAIFFISQYNLRVSKNKNHYFISSYLK